MDAAQRDRRISTDLQYIAYTRAWLALHVPINMKDALDHLQYQMPSYQSSRRKATAGGPRSVATYAINSLIGDGVVVRKGDLLESCKAVPKTMPQRVLEILSLSGPISLETLSDELSQKEHRVKRAVVGLAETYQVVYDEETRTVTLI